MPTFASSQDWLQQSQLLLAARPSSTKITTRYSIRALGSKPPEDGQKLPDTRPPRARLVLKTYDPVSGACLTYRTSKAAEVSRLVQMLGSLGRRMAALSPRDDGLLDTAVATESSAPTEGTVVRPSQTGGPQQLQQQQQQGGGGGRGKKKKGKR